MNKLLLVTLFVVGVLAQTSCKIPTGNDVDCSACVADIGSDECTELYKAEDTDKLCKEYYECKEEEARQVDTTVCPGFDQRGEVCLADFTGPIPGFGRDYQCKDWAKNGDCKTNPKFMIPHCMRSCCSACNWGLDGCPYEKQSDDQCETKWMDGSQRGKDQCEGWAYAGECEKNPVWMKHNCRASCCPACKAKAPKAAPTPAPAPAPILTQPTYPLGGYNAGWAQPTFTFGGYNTGYNTATYDTGYNTATYGLYGATPYWG